MKKTILLASLLIAFSLTKAQEGTTRATSTNPVQKSESKKGKSHASPDQRADKFVAKMNEAVGLEEAQKVRVRSLALDHFKNMESVKAQAQGDKEKIKAEGKNSRKMFNEGLKKVLSPAQFETWKTKRKEAAKNNKGGGDTESQETIED